MDVFEGITIDPPGARDLDDGIDVASEGDAWRVRIAFPRLTDLVPANGEVDRAARARGFTRYRAGRRPDGMLPDEVSDRLSLTPGGARDAFVLDLALDGRLEVVRSAVSRVAFVNVARLSYDGAKAVMGADGTPVGAPLAAAARLSLALERRRVAAGSLAFRDLGNGMATDEEGRAVASEWAGHWAERAVRELMILANATLARLCVERDAPILFRNHRARAAASREALLDDVGMARAGALSLDALAGRLSLVSERATLGPRVEGHWGLGLPAYAWFTSPIRRYADLVNQRNLEAVLAGREPPHGAGELADVGVAIDAMALAEAEARSEGLKRAAQGAGEAAIRRGRVAGTDAAGFTQVVKAATRGDLLGGEVLAEATRRLSRGELTVKDMGRLLASGVPAAVRPVVDHLVANPGLAVSLATHGANSDGWSPVTYAEEAWGPPHARTFRVVATVSGGGREASSPPCVASSLKDARQAACARAIARLFGVDVPAPDGPAPPPRPAEDAPRRAGANGKGLLLELCNARRWPQPTYRVTSSGPAHLPTFEAVARVETPRGPVESEGRSAGTAKGAEAAAALDLLDRVRRDAR